MLEIIRKIQFIKLNNKKVYNNINFNIFIIDCLLYRRIQIRVGLIRAAVGIPPDRLSSEWIIFL